MPHNNPLSSPMMTSRSSPRKRMLENSTTDETPPEKLLRVDTHSVNMSGPEPSSSELSETGTTSTTDEKSKDTHQAEQTRDTFAITSSCDVVYNGIMRQRIRNISNCCLPDQHIYSPKNVPLNHVSWSGATEGSEGKYMSIDGKPIHVWLVGEVQETYFLFAGQPQATAAVKIMPVVDGDLEAINTLLEAKANGTQGDNGGDLVRASRRMQGSGRYANTMRRFTSYFDATKEWTSKNLMRKLDIDNLTKNDLVMLECTLTRWRVGEDGRPITSGRWVKWRVGFELCAIGSLVEGPPDEGTAGSTYQGKV